MFFALMSAFLQSFALIYWKKSLWFWANKDYFFVLSYASIFLIFFILFFSWNLKLEFISIFYIFLIFWIIVSTYFMIMLRQYVFKKDKLSKILPYLNISKIITIILWFFIFADVSLFTLFVAILTTIIIFLFSMDLKDFTIPKTIKIICLSELLLAINTLLIWYILLKVSNISYFFYEYLIGIFFILVLMLFKKPPKDFYKLSKEFYVSRMIAAHLWWVSYIISLLVIKNLWVTMSILVSYVWIWVTLLFSFFILNDKPSKKDLILVFIVSVLIWVWYFFK